MDQHKLVLDQLNSMSTTMSDKDALYIVEKAQADLAVDFRRPLSDRKITVVESLTAMARGLKNHYNFEEDLLPPLLGQLLTEALKIEHKELMSEMQKTISTVSEINVKGLNHIDETSVEAIMNESLLALRNKKLDHQKREEAVLLTLLIICEEKAKKL